MFFFFFSRTFTALCKGAHSLMTYVILFVPYTDDINERMPDLNGEHVESSERASSIFRCIVDKSDWSYFASIELFEIRFGRFVQSLCIGASMCDIGYTAQDTAYFPAYRSCISSIKKFISFRSISTSNIDVEFSFPRSLSDIFFVLSFYSIRITF